MSYSIKITDNATGDILVEQNDLNAIVGALHTTGGEVAQLAITNCNTLAMCGVIDGCKNVVRTLLTKSPEVALLLNFAERVFKKEREGDNNE